MSAAAGRNGSRVAVHQFVPTLNPHDATGTHTLLLRDILRAAGWRSEIFAEAIHDDLASEAYKYWTYPEHAKDDDVALYQFSTSSAVAGFLAERSFPLILDFHNYTRAHLFAGWEPNTEARAARAVDELALLAPRAALGMADSSFNEQVLRQAGCTATVVVPVLVDYDRITGSPDARVNAELAAVRREGGADFLFVGRIVPSKAQHELIKALWAYHRLYDDRARLHLVGGTSSYEYFKALRGFAGDLGLARYVRLTGEVSDAALAAYYGLADAYVSLSVHEGFGVPLVEAMAAGVPVITRRAGAVAETLAGSGLLLDSLDHAYVAAAMAKVVNDDTLRGNLIDAGRRRAANFSLGAVSETVRAAVAQVAGAPR